MPSSDVVRHLIDDVREGRALKEIDPLLIATSLQRIQKIGAIPINCLCLGLDPKVRDAIVMFDAVVLPQDQSVVALPPPGCRGVFLLRDQLP